MEYTPLYNLLITTEDATQFCQAVDKLRDVLVRRRQTFEEASQAVLPHAWYEALVLIARQEKVDPADTARFDRFLEEVKRSVQLLPTIELTVAVDPDTELTTLIAAWLQKNTGKVFVRLKKDEQVLGGAILSFKGYYRDYSVQKKVTEYLTMVQ